MRANMNSHSIKNILCHLSKTIVFLMKEILYLCICCCVGAMIFYFHLLMFDAFIQNIENGNYITSTVLALYTILKFLLSAHDMYEKCCGKKNNRLAKWSRYRNLHKRTRNRKLALHTLTYVIIGVAILCKII